MYRAIGVANAFAAQDWDVTVLAADEAVFGVEGTVDLSLSGQVSPGVRVVRVPFTSGVYARDITQWGWMHARHPELWGVGHGLPFPETGFGDWRPKLAGAAEGVHRDRPVDLTIGTASPSVDFIPGWQLKRRHGVPTIMDYRDAWTIDVFTGQRNPRATKRSERWERRFVDAADQIWFVNEPIRSWHAAKYPMAASRMRVVPNGFDLADGVSPAVPFTPRDADRSLTFGYIGTINVGQFPAEPLLEGWRRARTRSPELARARLVLRGHLGRSGVAGETLDSYLRRAAQEGIVYEGPVAKADVAEAYAQFDALVLALASGPGVTSGKVFEFAATGLPVVSVHEPASAATTIMQDSPAWAPAASMSADDVASALIAGAALARQQTAAARSAAVEWGAQWERGRQLEAGVEGAAELLGGQRRGPRSQKERKQ
ncbi:glycosyltransferase [Microbacterium sp.]|uniref:glycosyltransferase n=1 Tax=Microbacterium sp. TaxID=51671 RepID=UPI003A93CEB5